MLSQTFQERSSRLGIYPLDKRNLGESVAGALLERPVGPLPPEQKFIGAGIYAIYYIGDFQPYNQIAQQNRKVSSTGPFMSAKLFLRVPARAVLDSSAIFNYKKPVCILKKTQLARQERKIHHGLRSTIADS